ncbi:tetratricopeptide repeat protein, partial [bacterium]|nr:tetratricopeptide repeat protein [bacterium]
QDITQDNKRTEYSAKSYYLLGKIFEEEKRDYDRAWEQFDHVGKEYPKSVYTDSARTKKRDILRLQALHQVIEMAITGSEDDLVTVESEEVERDTLWNGDLDLKTEITEEDSLQIDDQNGLVDETGDLEVEVDRDKPGDLETPGIEERVKPVENPELKTFKKEELDKNLLLLGELYLFRFLLPDSAVLKYRYLVNQLPQSKYAAQALYSLGFISMEIHKDPAGADTSFKMLVQNYPQSKFSNPARQHIDLPLLNTKEDSVKILFEEAEYFLFERDDPWTSFNKLNIIWQKYPNSVLAPKAIYTMAWIGENRLDSLNLSFALYDTLIHQYPKTEYAKKVKKKVDYVIAEKQKAIDDKEKRENENLQELNAKEQEVQIKDKDKEEIREKSERDEEESSVRRIEKTEESDSIQALPVGGISTITKQLAKTGTLKKHPFSG